jgi:hypothetical protein
MGMGGPPNFLYIGPDKSGSSWLFNALVNHPECFVPPSKDIYYFDKYYHRGESWYMDFFSKASQDALAVGEISHGYLFDENSPLRIKADFPDMKILTTLRNPVERAVSHYFYLRAGGLIDSDLKSAVLKRPGIILSSLYFEPLKRYLEIFPRDQVYVSFFEQLKSDPRKFAFGIFDFLGISEIETVDFQKRVREARKPKSVLVAKILKVSALKARDLGLSTLVGKIKNSKAINIIYKPLDSTDRAKISREEKNWILEQVIDDVEMLEGLLDKDLSHWKRFD